MSRTIVNNSAMPIYICVYINGSYHINSSFSSKESKEITIDDTGEVFVPSDYPNKDMRFEYGSVDTTFNISTRTYNIVGTETIVAKHVDGFTISSGGTSTITISDTSPITPTVKTVDITYSFPHTTIDKTTVELGIETSLNITCNDDYVISKIESTYIIENSFDDIPFTFTIASDNKTATYTGTFPTTTKEININGVAVEGEKVIPIEFNINNSTINKSSVNSGVTDTITITCETGYKFVNIDSSYYDTTIGDYTTFEFTQNTEKTIATYTGVFSKNVSKIVINGTTNKGEPVVKVENDLISILIPTDKELGELGRKRFYTIASSQVQQYDLGIYITSYKKIYVDKTDINILGKNSIVLGNVDTGVYSDVTDDYVVIKSLGQVYIPYINQNSTDFSNKSEIFLPFIGLVDVEISKILNRNVSIEYKINIINGDCNVRIIADNVTINSYDGNLGYQVPYIMNGNIWNGSVTNGYEFNPKILTSKKAFITIWYNEYNKSYSGKNTFENLNDLQGFIKIDNIDLSNIDLTFDEYNELKNILLEGVIY